jgi:hypothetical protein
VAAAPTGVRAGLGTASATAPYLARPGDGNAEARARLADGAGRVHRVTGIVGTMGVGGTTLAAVCFRAPAPQEPPLMVIISVVSCRVQKMVRLFLGRAGSRMSGRAVAAQYRTCRSRLRGERALASEDRPRLMRLVMNEPRP